MVGLFLFVLVEFNYLHLIHLTQHVYINVNFFMCIALLLLTEKINAAALERMEILTL